MYLNGNVSTNACSSYFTIDLTLCRYENSLEIQPFSLLQGQCAIPILIAFKCSSEGDSDEGHTPVPALQQIVRAKEASIKSIFADTADRRHTELHLFKTIKKGNEPLVFCASAKPCSTRMRKTQAEKTKHYSVYSFTRQMTFSIIAQEYITYAPKQIRTYTHIER